MFGNRQAPGGLSINTGAANATGINDRGPGGSEQAPKSGGLFGSSQQNKPAGSLFGSSTATSQAQGINFSAPSNPNQGGGLFGSSTAASQPQQSSLFGTTTSNPGGLFGASTTTLQPQQANNPFGGSLFGGQGTSNQQSQIGGLFGGSSTQQQGSGMFGATTHSQSNSIFAPTNTQSQQGSGLFGSTAEHQNHNLFSGSLAPSNPTAVFGPSTTQNQGHSQSQTHTSQVPAPSIFTASIGQLSQQQQTVPGVRVSVNELRPTTRYNDLHEDLQKMIESIDNFVLEQVRFQTQCEQALEGQGEGLQRGVAKAAETIPSDVEQCQIMLDATQQALENDVQAIASAKALTKADAANANLSFKALLSLRMPQQFQSSNMWNLPDASHIVGPTLLDDDILPGAASNLVSYFSMQADDMSKTLEGYKGRIDEVEAYLTGLEASIINQIQQLMFVRDREGGPKSAEDQVKELAAVLKEMEAGIMGVAGKVTGAREQVQEVKMSVENQPLGRRYGRY